MTERIKHKLLTARMINKNVNTKTKASVFYENKLVIALKLFNLLILISVSQTAFAQFNNSY
jgi:hypothetical protein